MATPWTLLGTDSFTTTSGTHSVTATPAVGDLPVIVTAHSGYTGTDAPTDNNPDGLGTYTLVKSAVARASADTIAVWVRDHLIGSATSTVFTVAPGTTSGGGLAVLKLTGMTRVSSNAVKKSGSQDNGTTGTTPAASWTGGGSAATTNPLIAVLLNASNPGGVAKPSTFTTRQVNDGYGTPNTGLNVATVDSGNTDSTVTWGGTSSVFGHVIVEFDGSPSGVTGSGGIAAAAASLAATGREDFKASGGPAASAASLAATGREDFKSAGGIAASAAALSGTGREDFKGTGAFAAAPASFSGTAHEDQEGSGGISAAAASLAGTGVERFRATGGFEAAAASLGSTGDEAAEGSGGLGAAAAHLSGTGHEDFEGTGGIVGGPAHLQGSEQPLNIGSGGIEGGPAALSGTGTVTVRRGGWGGFQRRERKRHEPVEPVPKPVKLPVPPLPKPIPAISGSGGITTEPAQLFGAGGLVAQRRYTGRASLTAVMANLHGEGETSVTVGVLEDRIAALEARLDARLKDAEALAILML